MRNQTKSRSLPFRDPLRLVRRAWQGRTLTQSTAHVVRTPLLLLSLMRPQSFCSVKTLMEPPNDLQRNCTVSPRAESRSLACFILANRGQARLTSTSPVHRHRQRHILSAARLPARKPLPA